MSKLYRNSVGVSVIVDTLVDTAGATDLELIVKLPDDSTAVWTCVAEGLTKIRYTIQVGDWAQIGVYLIQAKLTFSDRVLYGETTQIEVLDQFK